MPPSILLLFRHGETDWNAAERLQGHTDVPLNENGRTQARALARELRDSGIEVILSSDLARALETASIITEELGVPLHLDSRLRERDPGKLQGLTRSEILSRYGEDWFQWLREGSDTPYTLETLKVEPEHALSARATDCIHEFLSTHAFQKVGIVSHEGVIRRIIAKMTRERYTHPIGNGEILTIKRNRRA